MRGAATLAKIARSLPFTLGSFLVFIVAGGEIRSRVDARDVSQGDNVHSFFSVVIAPGDAGQPFKLIPLTELSELHSTHIQPVMLLGKESDRIQLDVNRYVEYRVLERSPFSQVIEVEEGDDDKTRWSRYRAGVQDVVPLSSRMKYFGYLFEVIPHAIVLTILQLAAIRKLFPSVSP